MLQKYHPNPLSHFLALHNSQATHNHVVDAHTLATTIANSQFHHHQQQHQQQHHHQHQQQQQTHHHQHIQLQQHQQQTAAAALLAANQHHQNSQHIQLTAHNLNSHTSPTQPSSPNHIHANQVNQHTTTILRQHHHHHQNSSHTQDLIEAAASTTLDAGKSFTIAAILGLQKSAMENSCKEYTNNVINLSLNGGCSSNNDSNGNGNANANIHHQPHLLTPEQRNKEDILLQHHQSAHSQPHHPGNNNNNNNNRDVTNMNVNKSSNICHTFHNNNNNINTSASSISIATSNTVNSFNCDNVVGNATAAAAATVLMNRYLPTAMVNVTGSVGVIAPTATPSIASFAATPVMAHQHQHSRANSFVAAAAAAAAAAVNVSGGPSALQSLQQLHQQHAAHQTNLNFQREKLKSGKPQYQSMYKS